ncbi:MAG: MgtC/SapB family protein [Planctomycetes bacterium]|nr:MgtC/SapB family protein [Planctomycetota bacterium]
MTPSTADVAPFTASVTELWLRVAIAAICGGLVGWDRERKDRPAGIRTHLLVAIGAAGFTLLATEMGEKSRAVDPTRMIQGVIGGVGFLGAGAILQSRGNVQGMTTAAGIWVVAAIGIAAGLGEYHLLAALLVMTLLALTVLHGVGQRRSKP